MHKLYPRKLAFVSAVLLIAIPSASSAQRYGPMRYGGGWHGAYPGYHGYRAYYRPYNGYVGDQPYLGGHFRRGVPGAPIRGVFPPPPPPRFVFPSPPPP